MLSLSFDSLSTKQQYMSPTVVPAQKEASAEKTVGDSVDDSVHNRRDSRQSLRKEPRQAFGLTGLSMLPPVIRAIKRSRSTDLSARVPLRRHESVDPKHDDRTQMPANGS